MLDRLEDLHPLLPPVAGVVALLVAALIADLLAKRILVSSLKAVSRHTSTIWDDALVRRNVAGRLAQLVPGVIVYSGIEFVPGLSADLVTLARNVTVGYMVLMVTLTLSAAIGAANEIYESYPVSRDRPLKGIAQLLQIVVFVLGGVLVVAALLDRSPLLLLSGLGAMTAVTLLVFQDSILGLVASVQLTANDMVRVGDWIEMPQQNADGDVIDIALHTVKVQNWDKTITTIPTRKLITESFKNWRGMSESGGRRIKRALYVDQGSIRFLSNEEVDHFKRFALLKDYISRKERELADFNAGLPYEVDEEVNHRRLTNVGTFRAYILNYLNHHPKIHHEGMTLLVRQLPPGPDGLPIEIYCFTTTTAWGEYEQIQADLFDHLLGIAKEFGLRIYQRPAGADLEGLRRESFT